MKDYFLRDGEKLKKIGIKKKSYICAVEIIDESNLKFNNQTIN